MKNFKSLEAVYIYIYIVRFNENRVNKSKKTMLFRRI